ncbi:MAG: ribonucleoside triphosphate reductase, partial [Firmicutes bacterium]|nr:ribonucleoside triphosphate reductase [Bacillota bacterium]
EFAKQVLDHMRERLSDYQEAYGDLYNLEATPAESTTYRFAKHDKEQFPNIITANENGTPYYTNSSHLPVGYTEDIFTALEIQDELQTRYTSGTVFHAFLGEKLPDWKAAASLVRKIAENHKLPYYTMSPTYSVCAEHGYLTGEQHICPHCGKEAEVYSRITGYYRPVKNWNDGKTQEYKDRKVYNIGTSVLKKTAPVVEAAAAAVAEKAAEVAETCACETACSCTEVKATLISRVTCPNCRVAEGLLGKAGVEYEKVIAEENLDMCRQYGVKGAPTLIIEGSEGFQSYYGVPEIKKYLATL